MRRIPVVLVGIAGLIFASFAFSSSAQAATMTFAATLLPANEIPALTPPGSPDRGTVLISINTTTNELCATGSITLEAGETISAQHIHPGAAGTAANPLIVFPSLNGCVTSDATNVGNIIAHPENFYFNVHTNLHPGGVARGQLAATDVTTLTAHISSTNEVPQNSSGTTGTAMVTIVDATNQVCVALTLDNQSIDNVVAMHIHQNVAGANGPVVVPFAVGATSCANPTPGNDLVSSILADPAGFYFNIHTAANPNGEARGQLDGSAPAPMMTPETVPVQPAAPVAARPAFTG
jgi:hypothetical protein